MQLRRHLLGQAQPLAVLLEGQVGMDAALHAELGRAELDRFLDPRGEVLLGDFVGVGRALALAEAAEGAADDADVGEVDVAVDDEGDRVPGQLGAQLVGGDPHLLDHLGPGLGEQRGQLVLGELHRPRAPSRSPARPAPASKRLFAASPGPSPRDEAPVLQLDHVEDALLHPLGVHVLRVDAEPLGQRVAPAAPAPCAPGAGSGTAPRARCGRRWRRGRRGRWPRPRPAPATSRRGSAGPARRRRASAACTPGSGA